jgi:biopolymer transport protein ExbB/TolQ
MGPPKVSRLNLSFLNYVPSAFATQLGGLVSSIILVHLFYLIYVRPTASDLMDAAAEAGTSVPRAVPIVLKDYEQEICLMLMLWATLLIGQKIYRVIQQRYILDADILGLPADEVPSIDKIKQKLTTLNGLEPDILDTVVVKTLTSVMRRYCSTGDLQSAADACIASAENEAARMESGLSMIRYIIWAIPSIGFIGTVRGIGNALSQAQVALQGDIAGMTESLGVAFNSTLVALLISILLMLLVHQLQEMQDSLVLETEAYCDRIFLSRLHL